VDESALTGESIPVDKTVDDTVSAATMNQSGYIKARATRVGEDTTFSQIIQMVSDAAATKAPIARIADRVSGIFVPAVIAIAVITVIGWLLAEQTPAFALARGISVLVISCPCALGLATPVAIMVGNGVGARNGILFKTSEALETCGNTQIIALDKTGTITEGTPKVTDVIAEDPAELIRLAAALERGSEHPLAKAVTAEAEGLPLSEITGFEALPGHGLRGFLDGRELLGGSLKFLASKGTVDESVKNQANALAEEGKTPLLFALGGELAGLIAVADPIKKDSAQAIRELRNMGIQTVMLTGDNERTAAAISK
jgi:Cu2+-exporting ATPase